MGRRLIDIANQRFGRLTALEHVYLGNIWRCLCECGARVQVSGYALRKGYVKSCGCLNSELAAARKRTHGLTSTVEYIIWSHAKGRCTNPRGKQWSDYGGRGITMSAEWAEDFTAFLRDMGKRPTPRHSLDRINNDGGYERGNCRWATQTQQTNNRRVNRFIEWRGERHTLAEWGRITGLPHGAIRLRLDRYGYTVERALTQPVGHWKA